MPQTIHRAALGRVAKIGALYDVRTESFLGDTLFGSKLDDDDVDTVDLGETLIDLVLTDNIQEKCNKLGVEAELQVSLLSGLVEISGLGSYLGEERKSARAQSMSLLYKLKTKNDEVMIRQNKDKIDMDILSPKKGEEVNATHVVYAIDWGAVCSVTCKYDNTEGEDENKVKAALSAELEKLKGKIDINGSASAEYDDKDKEIHKQFTFTFNADVSAPDKALPVTFEGAVKLARTLPSLAKGTNNGKGVPLTYMLKPLETIVKMCRLEVQIQSQYRAIDEGTIKKCAQVVEGITKKKQTLYDIHTDFHACEDYVNEESLATIDNVLDNFVVEESGFKAELQTLVKKVRSGDGEVSALEAFLGKEDTLVTKFNDQIRGFQVDFKRVNSVKSWKRKGIIYIGRKDQLTVDDKLNVYIFYKTANEDDKENHDKNQEFFLQLQKTHAQNDSFKFVVVDQEIRMDLWPADEDKASIYKLKSGIITSTSVYIKEGQDMELCLIKFDKPAFYQKRPNNRARVKLGCPNALSKSGECTGNPVIWMCSECKDMVEYGIDTKFFYCKCGESDPKRSLFRCYEKEHGMDYVRYPNRRLTVELSRLRPMQEINILILGEKGVGKSTWINGFHNYLYYANLEDAIKAKEFDVMIPSSFTYIDDNGETEIQVGENDTNERMETGKSSTKDPRAYCFYLGDSRIHLIDTPGIGDCDGMQQDVRNFDNILAFLTSYEQIHAVCILLKPNNSRLTAMFRFCIQELLAHLHSSAKDNIVFCFTNARATFYKPGDTLPALKKELKERDVEIDVTSKNNFCFDNEAFRFLACLKNGVEFCNEDVATYTTSWQKSVEETKRLFQYIRDLPPHEVRNTLSMNEARRIIVAMSKPLAEVAKMIQMNVHQGEEAKSEIDLYDKDMHSKKANLTFSGFGLKRIELGYPRTVCADSECVKHVPVGESGVQNTVYQQICHDECTLQGIPPETTNDTRLENCLCIWPSGTGDCVECGHHYTKHMHITYDTEVFTEEFLSQEVQTQINHIKSARGKREAQKEAIDTKIRELKEEETIITKTSAKYGSFLKANALIAYNDAVGDYLDMLVDLESKKEREFRNNQLLESFRKMKRQYEHERKILDNAIGKHTGENINTPEEVKELQKKLFGLKHMGKYLENLFVGISISRSNNSMAFQVKTAPVRQNVMTQVAVAVTSTGTYVFNKLTSLWYWTTA